MLIAEDSEKLEAALTSDEPLELAIRYVIKKEAIFESASSVDEEVEIPKDLSEAELMEMLTEVMSVMLFNKDE